MFTALHRASSPAIYPLWQHMLPRLTPICHMYATLKHEMHDMTPSVAVPVHVQTVYRRVGTWDGRATAGMCML